MPVRESRKQEVSLKQAMSVVESINTILPDACERFLVCGSVRREAARVGDIDVLVVPNAGTAQWLRDIGWDVTEAKAFGFVDDVAIDVYFTEDSTWGPMVAFLTGSQYENIRLRASAKSRGWKLSQYGLFDEEGSRVDDNTEESIYAFLDKPYKNPSQR